MSPLLLACFCLAVATTVAYNYTNQAILGLLQHDFALSPAVVAAIPLVTQIGNAAGVIFISPLGDRLERKYLINISMCMLAVALLSAALAPNFTCLAISSTAIGLCAAVTQQFVPFAMNIVAPAMRTKVLGILTGAILVGILLARFVAGAASDLWGWRVMFAGAGGVTLLMEVVLIFRLPTIPPATRLGYVKLLGSMVSLLKESPALRRASMIQGFLFSGFMAFWSNLALVLSGPPYRLGATAVGLMALIGVGGIFAAPVAGYFSDKVGTRVVVSAAGFLVLCSFAILELNQGSLIAMVIAALIMDLAIYSAHVANWSEVHSGDSDARSRMNTIFMASMIFSGACGGGAGGLAYSIWGWKGTCAVGLAISAVALTVSLGAGFGYPDIRSRRLSE